MPQSKAASPTSKGSDERLFVIFSGDAKDFNLHNSSAVYHVYRQRLFGKVRCIFLNDSAKNLFFFLRIIDERRGSLDDHAVVFGVGIAWFFIRIIQEVFHFIRSKGN